MMSRDDCAVRVQWFSSVKIIGRDRERTAAMHADCRRLVAEKDDGKILKIGRQGTDSRPSAVTVLSLKESRDWNASPPRLARSVPSRPGSKVSTMCMTIGRSCFFTCKYGVLVRLN